MRWVDAHREAMAVAAECHDELQIDVFSRIDVFSVFSDLRMKLLFKRLGSCAALYLPSAFAGRPGALINSQHPLALQRYSGAHELGHHRFEHGPKIDRDVELRLRGHELPPEEKLAEAFAAWFLMPPELGDVVFEDALILDKPHGPHDVYAAALRFGTSYSATCVHLVSLKRVSRTQSEAWLKVPLKSIKTDVSPIRPLGGWRNDVWHLTEHDIGGNLLVRPGDRLIFDLPGQWTASELPEGAILDDTPRNLLDLVIASCPVVIDLAPEMRARPATIRLSGGASTASFTLDVERPREGLYVPRQPARSRT